MARIPVCFLLTMALWLTPSKAFPQASNDDDLLVPVGASPAPPPAGETTAPPEEVKASTVTEAPAAKAVEKQEAAPKIPEAAATDRVKAVPRKPILKRGRFEVFGAASLSLNDAFYNHFAFNAAVAYFPHDAFGLGIGADYFYAQPKTSNIDVVRQSLTSVPAVFELPKLFAHAERCF